MKVRKFIKRERRTEGQATGSLVCNVSFPEAEEQYDIRPLGDAKTIFKKTLDFLIHHLQERTLQSKGASFTISAEMRAKNGGIRRKSLVTWNEGESVKSAVRFAQSQWEGLEFETDYESFETEIMVKEE